MSGLGKLAQFLLLLLGLGGLLALAVLIGLSVSATQAGSTPAAIVQVEAGAYPLTVSLYKDLAQAGFALPFAIAPRPPISGPVTITVVSVPDDGVSATPVWAGVSPDPAVPGGVRGAAEITVRGAWRLHITVDGRAGHGEADVPVTAVAPPPIPAWLGWAIGFVPIGGLLAFLLAQRTRQRSAVRVS